MEANNTQPQQRHQPSVLNTHFVGTQQSFGEYVMYVRDMLKKVHGKRIDVDVEKVIEGNAPFELKSTGERYTGQNKKYQRGVLLVHGLTDSPYFMRYLGDVFQEQGFRVMAILLPGHGTQPSDLLDVAWQEWAKVVGYGADKLSEEADEIYLAGFSVGAALGVLQSLHDARIRGLFLFSPALKITARAALANLHKLYSWLMPSAKWMDIKPDNDIYKYESVAKNAVYQTYQLIKNINHKLRSQKIAIPVFAAASLDDVTVDSLATINFMRISPHPLNHLILYGTDSAKKPTGFPTEKLEWVNSVFPKEKILGSAHTAIVLPAEDPHYGAQGQYSNCLHYYSDDMEKYAACFTKSGNVLQGEITPENLRVGVMRRLMYNPNFDSLKISMKKFIGNLP